MADWFATKKEAGEELDRRRKNFMSMDQLFKWTHTKRKKPFFVGSYLEWINK